MVAIWQLVIGSDFSDAGRFGSDINAARSRHRMTHQSLTSSLDIISTLQSTDNPFIQQFLYKYIADNLYKLP
jgi:hypothetical protein